jgi:ATP-dependent Lon protease
MAQRKVTDVSYSLDKFELPPDLRAELQAKFDRRTKARDRRQERARKKAFEDRRSALERQQKPPETLAAIVPARPSDTNDFAYIEAFTANVDEWDDYERRTSDRDELLRNKKAASRLRAVGPWRPTATVPFDWRARLDALQTRFPNFDLVIDGLRTWFALADHDAAGRKLIWFPPLLLEGVPGVGKTMFVEAMARTFGLPLHRLDMASAQTSSRLTGSDEHWSNSKPGLLFEILAFNEHGGVANPIVLLDELEKTSGDQRYDPLGALYTLLEPRTAGAFTDMAFPRIRLDASHILFVGTANDASSLPEPIRSRMRQYVVPGLDGEASRVIARALASEVARSLGLEPAALSVEILARLDGLAPRTVRHVLHEAFGRALDCGRNELVADDIVRPQERNAPRRIGFVLEEGP